MWVDIEPEITFLCLFLLQTVHCDKIHRANPKSDLNSGSWHQLGVEGNIILPELSCDSPPEFNNMFSVPLRPRAVRLIHFPHRVLLCKPWQTRILYSRVSSTPRCFHLAIVYFTCGRVSLLYRADSSCLQRNFRRICKCEQNPKRRLLTGSSPWGRIYVNVNDSVNTG